MVLYFCLVRPVYYRHDFDIFVASCEVSDLLEILYLSDPDVIYSDNNLSCSKRPTAY